MPLRASGGERRGAELKLESITKVYGGALAVRNLDLTIAAGEFVTLLGASGSGKTTTLMMLAGFTPPTSGRISIGGKDVTALPAGKRDLGVVFQNYSLFPHLTVAQNLAFPLEMRKVPRAEIKAHVQRILDMVHLPDKAERYPRELSGGQQQRVALGRAIIFQPQALLMDEPLGALDKNLRENMQMEIKRLHASLGATIVFVTHDQEEALTLSDRVAVMHDGTIVQIASPRDIYEAPVSRRVADFIGQSNFLPGVVEWQDGEDAVIRLDSGERLRGCGPSVHQQGKRVLAVLRPERIRVVPFGETSEQSLGSSIAAEVTETLYLGHTIKLALRLEDGSCLLSQSRAEDMRMERLSPGAKVIVTWGGSPLWCVDAEEAEA